MADLILALDTATRSASLALHDGARVRVELTWESPDHHTIELAPRIAGALAEIDARMQDLTAIAVSLGPGSFTGLRVGVALAKGLALAGHLKLVGVPTLDIMAFAAQDKRTPLVAVLAAGRGRLCASRYRYGSRGPEAEGPAWLTTAAQLGDDWQGPARLCGELDAEERQTIVNKLGDQVQLALPAACLRRAGFLAEIAWNRLRAGHADDPATLVPIYIQTPSGSPA